MTTMTMPTTVERTSSRASSTKGDKRVSQLLPMLVGFALFAVVGLASMLISGPMH